MIRGKPVKALLDTVVTRSVISENFAVNMGINIFEEIGDERNILTSATGHKIGRAHV